jgi:ABC-type antimicrobial peptide transport system permease subunit
MFATIDQVGGSNQYFVLARTTGDPDLVVAPIRKVLSELDPDQPLYAIQSMETAVAGALFPQRVSLVLVGVLAVGAMLVAALGVYGVVDFFVASRTREIGIRVALGATAGRITRVIVGQTMWLLVAGAVLGVAGGAYVASLASRLLYESPAVDVSAVAGVLGVLVFVGLLASWFPSRRAHRVDPIRALRID